MKTSQLRRLAAGSLMPGFVGTTSPQWLLEAFDDGLAAVCLFGTNLQSWEQLSDLCTQLRQRAPHALLSVDEEGGDVTRLHYLTGSNQPGNAVLGRLNDLEATTASAAAIASELAAFGINLNLAPDADVNSAADNPVIGSRSFGASPQLVSAHTIAWIDGMQSAGVAACAKHFPGHGDTSTDSHVDLPRILVDAQTLAARELLPFQAAAAVGVASIMTSHIIVDALDPQNPATFSRIVLMDVLRGQLGFTGAIITDALDMVGASGEIGVPAAAVKALTAGADLLCIGSETTQEQYLQVLDAIEAAVVDGTLPLSRLRDAAEHTAELAANYPATVSLTQEVISAPDSVPTSAGIRAAFEITPKAISWLEDPSDPALIQVETNTNYAVGTVPWGPAATGATVDVAQLVPGQKVAVSGRGLAKDHQAWEVAQTLAAAGHHTIVVECGWPRGGADIVTYGASLAVSGALVELLS